MNVLNVPDIERELARIAAHAFHPAAQEWLKSVPRNHLLGHADTKDIASNFRVYNPRKPEIDMPRISALPPWATKALRRKEVLHWFDPIQVRRRPFWQALEHIVDWFNSWPQTDTRLPRLSRINYVTAATAASLWLGNVTTHLWDYIQDRPPLVKSYENGFHWVRLVTNLHFERESHMQGHCIGNGHYYQMFKRGDTEYLSLRDKENKAHVTIEVSVVRNTRIVRQVKGHGNQKPGPQYQPYIRRFFNDMGWKIEGDEHHVD